MRGHFNDILLIPAALPILLWLHRRKKFSGQVILAYAMIYATVRFLIEFVRDDPRGDIFGLTTLTGLSTSQMISILVGVAALITFVVRRRRANAAQLSSAPAHV